MKPFFVYMLRCRDGSYYVGHTDDLERRMAQHHDGTSGGHSARKRPVTLVWCHDTATREEALERELQLKRWTRAKKEALIRDDWSSLKRLARGPDRHERERSARDPRPPFDSAPGAAPAANDAGRYAQGEREKGDAGCDRGKDLDSAPGALTAALAVQPPRAPVLPIPPAPLALSVAPPQAARSRRAQHDRGDTAPIEAEDDHRA